MFCAVCRCKSYRVRRYAMRFENTRIIDTFAVLCQFRRRPSLPEWRNGRRDGLKIHCPLKAWGFESPLGHLTDSTVRTLSEFRSCSDGLSFAYALPALHALRGTPYTLPYPLILAFAAGCGPLSGPQIAIKAENDCCGPFPVPQRSLSPTAAFICYSLILTAFALFAVGHPN